MLLIESPENVSPAQTSLLGSGNLRFLQKIHDFARDLGGLGFRLGSSNPNTTVSLITCDAMSRRGVPVFVLEKYTFLIEYKKSILIN